LKQGSQNNLASQQPPGFWVDPPNANSLIENPQYDFPGWSVATGWCILPAGVECAMTYK